MLAYLFIVIGLLAAFAAHVGAVQAKARAKDFYQATLGEHTADYVEDDFWYEVRPVSGRWGCAQLLLELARAAGLLMALGSLLYLLAG